MICIWIYNWIYKMKTFFLIIYIFFNNPVYAESRNAKTTFPLPSPVTYKTIIEHDFHQAVEKLAHSQWEIINRTDQDIPLMIKSVYVDANYGRKLSEPAPTQEISISPQQRERIQNPSPHKTVITNVQFNSKKSPYFLSLENTGDGYKIVITKNLVPTFPQYIASDDLTPKLLDKTKTAPLKIPSPQIPPKELCLFPDNIPDGYIDYYNTHVNFLYDTLFPREKINAKDLHDRINSAYRSFNQKISYKNPSGAITRVKVPPIIHTLWFTADKNPKELPERYIYWLKKCIEACPPEQGFSHWLWVHDKTKLPQTMKLMKELHVEVHETHELGDFPLKNLYEDQFNNKRFGRASDLFRLAVLYKVGGIYRDTDYRIHQSLLPLLEQYNFIAAREPFWSFISNALLISSPGHPMIHKAIEIVERNCLYKANPAPDYLLKLTHIQDEMAWDTVFKTGPGMFYPVLDHAFDREDWTDVLLPHSYFIPSHFQAYPQPHSVGWGDSVPLPAYGAHYFENSWTTKNTKEFGSIG